MHLWQTIIVQKWRDSASCSLDIYEDSAQRRETRRKLERHTLPPWFTLGRYSPDPQRQEGDGDGSQGQEGRE